MGCVLDVEVHSASPTKSSDCLVKIGDDELLRASQLDLALNATIYKTAPAVGIVFISFFYSDLYLSCVNCAFSKLNRFCN